MATRKRVFFSFNQGDGQSLFFRAWQLMNLEGPLTPKTFTPDLGKIEREVGVFTAQMRRQQVHIDEIKRLCHVPVI